MISYAHTQRPDTGMTNAALGMGLFLAAEAMFFGALFSSFAFLRTAAPYWPVGRDVLPLGLNALALTAMAMGCAMAVYAWAGARHSPKGGRARVRAGAAAGWGALAVLLLAGSLHQTFREAGPPSATTFLAIYYVLTILVLVHALIALLLSVCIAFRPWCSPSERSTSWFGNIASLWAFGFAMAVTNFAVFHLI